MMKRCGLAPSHIDEVLAVLNNQRQGDFKSGWVRVKGLSKPTVTFLKREHFIAKAEDRKLLSRPE